MDRIACLKHGFVSLWDSCKKFSYDPLKRQPERPRKLPTPEDVPGNQVFHL